MRGYSVLGGGAGGAAGVASARVALRPEDAVLAAGLELIYGQVRLAPQFDPALTYDPALGTAPDTQGWTVVVGGGTRVFGGGLMTVSALSLTGPNWLRTTGATSIFTRYERMRLDRGAGVGTLGFIDGGGVAGLQTFIDGAGSQIQWAAFASASTIPVGRDLSVARTVELVATNWFYTQVAIDGVVYLRSHDYSSEFRPHIGFARVGAEAGQLGEIGRVRIATGNPFLATGPYSRNVFPAGVSRRWSMSSIASLDLYGGLLYQYGASDAALPPLNGVDLTLAQLQAAADPVGKNFRVDTRFPGDGSANQARAWGGLSIVFASP